MKYLPSSKIKQWRQDNLPSKGERSMAGLLVVDSKLLSRRVAEVWADTPVTLPVVLGKLKEQEVKVLNIYQQKKEV